MRIYINLFFLVMLFCAACKSTSEPEGIIPQKKMTDLLIDVHIVDGSVATLNQTRDSLYKYGMDRYLQLFKKYHTDTLQFKKSLEYYTMQPKVFDAMYDEVVAKLQAKTDSLNKLRVKLHK